MTWEESQQSVSLLWMDKFMLLNKQLTEICQKSLNEKKVTYFGEFQGHPVYISVGYGEPK